MTSTEQASVSCEHHWISVHQPDFPEGIYWVQICSLCEYVNGEQLAKDVAAAQEESRAEIERLREWLSISEAAVKSLAAERDAMREAVTRVGEADRRAIHMYSDAMIKWHARTETAEAERDAARADAESKYRWAQRLASERGDFLVERDALRSDMETLSDDLARGDLAYPIGVGEGRAAMWAFEQAAQRVRSVLDRSWAPQCSYEKQWTDEVGDVWVCTLHGNNSRHHGDHSKDLSDSHAPCLTVDPYHRHQPNRSKP